MSRSLTASVLLSGDAGKSRICVSWIGDGMSLEGKGGISCDIYGLDVIGSLEGRLKGGVMDL